MSLPTVVPFFGAITRASAPSSRKEAEMKSSASRVLCLPLMILLSLVITLRAQDATSAEQDDAGTRPNQRAPRAVEDFKGLNEYEAFQGVIGASDSVLKLDSTLGYDFNRYTGIFVGVPLYFVHELANANNPTFNANGAGDIYFGLDFYAPTSVVNYSTTFTLSAPTGSVNRGFSTGHPTVDWSNRFRRRFGRLTPFAIAGVSNTVPDTDLVTRTFISLGNVVHLEEGAEYELTRRLYTGGSAYHVLPFGNQQVFNRLEHSSSGGNAAATDRETGSQEQPSASGNNLTRENGLDTWLGFEPTRVLRMEVGYSRSVTFALNRLSFNVGVNVGRMLRSLMRHQN